MWRQSWEQLFYSFIVIAPYVLIYAWSNRFWLRTLAGFICCSQGFSQLVLLLDHEKEDLHYPYLPFGSSSDYFIALCIATGVTGALFAGFSESLGMLLLQVWGTYTFFTFLKVRGEGFDPMRYQSVDSTSVDAMDRKDIKTWICFGVLLLFFISTMFNAVRPLPPKFVQFALAAVPGAAFGAHALSEVVYYLWGTPPARCGLHPMCKELGINPNDHCCPTIENVNLGCCETRVVYGMFITNRHLWCSDKSTCQELFGFFIVICLVSLVAQASLFLTEQELPSFMFQPAHLGDRGSSLKDTYWDANLRTTKTTWLFLFFVLLGSSIANYAFAGFVKWAADTSFFWGLVFVVSNAFCLWAIIEFFFLTIFFHVIRIVFDIPALPRCDFRRGLPDTGRTFLSYCLLSQDEDCSRECFDTAQRSHLANLDPNGRVSTGVVSVTKKLAVLQFEMQRRDFCREETRKVLNAELETLLKQEWALADEDELLKLVRECLASTPGSLERARYWASVLRRGLKADNVNKCAHEAIEEAAKHFMYLHRNCKILKKPGQYQDLMVLSSTGSNQAYTYLNKDYGEDGRQEGSSCFGFTGNVDPCQTERSSSEEAIVEKLEKASAEDIAFLSELGKNPATRYHYTMVLDSDTQCPPRSIRQLVEVAEHTQNRRHGIINANLAHDFRGSEGCTWHMWRSALIEVSKVNLLRGQYVIYDRVGFYGKGLVRNDMYINRVIGIPSHVVEALPFEILSHDTVEAKLLQPALAHEVTLYEDVACNPISAFAQSTRWLLGEVRNSCFHDGFYKFVLTSMSAGYTWLRKCKQVKRSWTRWREVPCSVGAEYLSLIGFRGFHAGAVVLLINILTTLIANPDLSWGLQLTPGMQLGRSTDVLMFTVLTLFIIPNAFMILGKLPSCELGKRCYERRAQQGTVTVEADEETPEATPCQVGDAATASSQSDCCDARATVPLDVESVASSSRSTPLLLAQADPRPGVSGCMRVVRLVVLILLEIVSSVCLYGPELVEGCLRLFRAMSSQVTGQQKWTPQDQVEREVRDRLSPCYVLGKTWCVFTCGVLYFIYLMCFKIHAPLNLLLCATWVLHPITTYIMCKPVPESMKSRWLWTWIMEEREFKNKQHEVDDE
mmetsp:Transcript_37997/g.88793  ORF Transcript_37997/g.88793 Transcript_37997/m.88793 type:complete len:1125 (+) Transcript_37997:104-3478(+)